MNIRTQDVPSVTCRHVLHLYLRRWVSVNTVVRGQLGSCYLGHYILGLWTDHLQSVPSKVPASPRNDSYKVYCCKNNSKYDCSSCTPVHSTGEQQRHDRIRNARSNAETVVQTRVTKKHHSSILLEAVAPKYKCTASVWIVCNTMSLSHQESLGRSSHGFSKSCLILTSRTSSHTSHGSCTYADR